jgi:hypothetical protein
MFVVSLFMVSFRYVRKSLSRNHKVCFPVVFFGQICIGDDYCCCLFLSKTFQQKKKQISYKLILLDKTSNFPTFSMLVIAEISIYIVQICSLRTSVINCTV